MLADTNPKMRGYFNPRSREGSDFTCRLKGSCINISIRAPTRGATIIGMLLTLSSRFQSALPRGERLVSVQIVILQLKISIRAPARGATLYAYRLGRIILFQSALPRGERPPTGLVGSNSDSISIRAPARGATLICNANATVAVFQSALPRGERRYSQGNITNNTVFQSALPRGERRHRRSCLLWVRDFNPRSREGSDIDLYKYFRYRC